MVTRDAPRFPKVHYRRPQRSGSTRVSSSLRTHLLWRTKTDNLLRPVPLSPPTPTSIVWTDASDSGSSLNHEAWGVWSQLNALQFSWSSNPLRPLEGSALLMRSDNTVAVAWINRQCSNTSKRLNSLGIRLQSLCLLHQWTIRASYIPSPQNTWADSLSRGHLIPSEWGVVSPACSGVVSPAASPLEPPGGPVCSSRKRVSSSRSHPRVPAKTSRIGWPRHFRGARLTSLSMMARAPSKGSQIDLHLQVHQFIRGVLRTAQEETSLCFHAFNFWRKILRLGYLSRLPSRSRKLIGRLLVPNMRLAGSLSSNSYSFNQQELCLKDSSSPFCIFCHTPRVWTPRLS